MQDVWDPFCFFLTSLGYTIGWTALSSMLASFKLHFGPAVLLQLNLAYFIPSIPVLYLQTKFDVYFNRLYGLPQAMAARMILGLGGSGLLCVIFPFLPLTLSSVLKMTCLLGLCCGIAFGSSYQLVSHQVFSVECNLALTIGFVGSGPIVLLLEVVDEVGPQPTQSQRLLLYGVVAFFAFLGLAAWLMLLHWHWEGLLRPSRKVVHTGSDVERGERLPLLEDSFASPFLGTPAGSGDLGSTIDSSPARSAPLLGQLGSVAQRPGRQSGDTDRSFEIAGRALGGKDLADSVSTWQLAVEVWPAAVALGVSVGCATLFFPFFTYVPSSGWLQALLPQTLFFSRTLSDIAGRFIPHSWLGLTTRKGLHTMTLIKLAIMPVGFWYIMAAPVRSDAAAVLYICLFWLQCGIVNSASFVMATKWATPGLQDRAGGFLALVFQTSCLVALGIAFLIQQQCDPFRSQWIV